MNFSRLACAVVAITASAFVHSVGLVDPADPELGIVDVATGSRSTLAAMSGESATGRIALVEARTDAYAPCGTLDVVVIAPPGKRDESFGDKGVVRGEGVFGCVAGAAFSVAVDGSDRVVVTYYRDAIAAPLNPLVVARLDAQGHLDATFGSNGQATLDSETMTGVRLRTFDDGGVLVAGRAGTYPGSVVVFKLSAAGVLDAGFAAGGMLTLAPQTELPALGDVRIAPDSRILIAWTPVSFQPVPTLERRLPSGLLDPTFGSGGRVSGLPVNNFAEAVTLQGDRIVVGLHDSTPLEHYQPYRLYAFDATGLADKTFGVDGQASVIGNEVYFRRGMSLTTDALGRVVGIVYEGIGFRLLRWTTSGVPDQSFGADGTAMIVVADGRSYYLGLFAGLVVSSGAVFAAYHQQ